jgi:hypothetical protein
MRKIVKRSSFYDLSEESEESMNTFKRFYKNPIWWVCLLFISAGVLIIGWKLSFPILYPPVEQALLSQISPLFWIGLWGSLVALGGLVQTTEIHWIPWLASIALVLILSSPQFLYTGYGSDAGSLPTMVDYTITTTDFNITSEVSAFTYAQWPASIFYIRFLSDLIGTDSLAATRLGFGIVAVCVAASLFLLWSFRKDSLATSRAVFWGIVVYFVGFYWFFNWQAAPYTFALALLLPSMALLEIKGAKFRIILFLLIISGMEAHALSGVWMILITISILLFTLLFKKEDKYISSTLIALIIVSQISLIIYKNTLFFRYITLNFQGYYNALLDTGASDKAIAIQANNSLSQTPPDFLGQLLKVLAYIDLSFIFIGLLTGFLYVLISKRIKPRETSWLVAGSIYFLIGMFFVAIGTRSLQIIGLALAFFVVDSIAQQSRISRYILIACIIGLVLFPSSLMRGHQINSNIIRPLDIAIKNFITDLRPKLENKSKILVEGVRLIDIPLNRQVISLKTINIKDSCKGPYLIIDSTGLRTNGQALLEHLYTGNYAKANFENRLLKLHTSQIYDAGVVSLYSGENCQEIYDLFK